MHGNIFDHIVTEFVYPNGVIMHSHCRQYPREQGIYRNISEWIVGSKGTSNARDMGTPGNGNDPYMQEHIALMDSIRDDGPTINMAMEVAESTMTCIMGRESAYSGQEISWNDVMMSKLDLQPKNLTESTKMSDTPVPVPGTYKFI